MLRIKRIAALLATVALCIPLIACAKTEYQSRIFYAMDTYIELYIDSDKAVSDLLDDCEAMVYSVEATLSKTKSGSDVARLNENGVAVCSDMTVELINTAKYIYDATDGVFDITVEPVISLWDSLEGTENPPDKQTLSELLGCVGMDKIKIDGNTVTLEAGTKIDLGGIAKGYAAGKLVELIEENTEKYEVVGGLLSFGGAVSVFGEKRNGESYKVAVRTPDDANKNLGYFTLQEGNVSVSGDYERYWTVGGNRYHHILNPQTGYPADNGLRCVAVRADDGMLSDALSTALFALGYDKSAELYNTGIFEFEAVFVLSDGSILTTKGAEFTAYDN